MQRRPHLGVHHACAPTLTLPRMRRFVGGKYGTISRRFADVGDDWTSSCPALCRVSTPSFPAPKDVDGRDKPGQDEKQGCNSSFAVTACFPRTALPHAGEGMGGGCVGEGAFHYRVFCSNCARRELPRLTASLRPVCAVSLPAKIASRSPAVMSRRCARSPRRSPRNSRSAASLSSHSIISSAIASSAGGTVRPSALAVLRLMISENFVGC